MLSLKTSGLILGRTPAARPRDYLCLFARAEKRESVLISSQGDKERERETNVFALHMISESAIRQETRDRGRGWENRVKRGDSEEVFVLPTRQKCPKTRSSSDKCDV